MLGCAGLACADEGRTVTLKADDVIAARQEVYDLMSAVVVSMKDTVQSGGDVKDYKDAAEAIATWGRIAPSMFPDGTQEGHDTHAKPNIWSDREGFTKAAANLSEQATKLAQVADSGDKAAFADQFKATTAACGACHKVYKSR
jgi:cytochrome c556